MTHADIQSVISRIPTIGFGGARADDTDLRARRVTREQFLARQQAEQDEMFKYGPLLSLVCVWCSAVPRVKNPSSGEGSYAYKHHVERNFNQYVSNGQFITAAVFCGIPFKLDGMNAEFGISRRVPKNNYGHFLVTGPLPGQPADWWQAIQNTDGESLWRSIIASPGDALPRNVLADWLEERGRDGWAKWLREITQIVTPNVNRPATRRRRGH